jgi:hypothetical protein
MTTFPPPHAYMIGVLICSYSYNFNAFYRKSYAKYSVRTTISETRVIILNLKQNSLIRRAHKQEVDLQHRFSKLKSSTPTLHLYSNNL